MFSAFFGCTKDYSDLPQISVSFSWPEKNVHEISPEIKLNNVPDSTKSFQINMFDLDNRYNHGGGTIVNDGSRLIPEGALKKYRGPAPIYGSPRYEISVKALDEKGKVVAFGKKMRKFPPETE
jgi:phosphatidylethanolamine-binding protein (PEBP) family uncharacterized protein